MIGKSLGHYDIKELLGKGGMGEVYLAEDSRLERRVAVKLMAPELSRDREARIRFQNEAKAAAELSHPNIATILDVGEADERPFLVFEYIEGETLRERVGRGPLPIEEVLRIGRALAEGLVEAHSHGIVHRDIKSANVQLPAKGGVKILDFGLAHRLDATKLTRPGTTLGTIGYMSPEQADGDSSDARTDIWSLGVVLYECLMGELPFRGESEAATLNLIRSADPVPPTGKRTGVPLELEQVVLRCLEKDPQLRYQHSDDLLADLKRVGAAPGSREPVQSQPARASSNWPMRAAMTSIVLVAAIAVVAFLVMRQGDSSPDGSEEWTLAVMDFEAVTAENRLPVAAALMGLLEVGLVESSPVRVLSPDYLRDLQRRTFDANDESIDASQALEVARRAGARHMLGGQIVADAGVYYATWRLVEPASGRIVEAGRTGSGSLTLLADEIVPDVVRLLSAEVGVERGSVTTGIASLTTNSPRAVMQFAAARIAEEEGRDADARRSLESAVEADSTFALAYLALSRQFNWNSERREAFPPAQRAWELRSRLGARDRMRLEAHLAMLGERYDEAESIYSQILSRWPDDLSALRDLTTFLDFQWCGRKGLPVVVEALRLYPEDIILARNQIGLLGDAGRYEEGLATARSYSERFPSDPTGWSRLSWLSRLVGDLRGAIEANDEATKLAARADKQGYALYGLTLRAGTAPHEVIANLEEQLQVDSLEPAAKFSIWRDLGWICAQVGRFEDSLEWLDLARANSGGWRSVDERYQRWTGQSEEILERTAAAFDGERIRAPATAMSDWEPERSLTFVFRTVRTRVGALLTLRREDEAELLLNELEDIVPETACDFAHHIVMMRASISLARNEPQDALRWLDTTPHATRTMEKRAQSRWLMGELDEAIRLYHARLAYPGLFSSYALTHYQLARVLDAAGRGPEAKPHYERFLELWSDADAGLVYPEPGPMFGVAPKEDAEARLLALQR